MENKKNILDQKKKTTTLAWPGSFLSASCEVPTISEVLAVLAPWIGVCAMGKKSHRKNGVGESKGVPNIYPNLNIDIYI